VERFAFVVLSVVECGAVAVIVMYVSSGQMQP
jgi:hypothetical protein